MKHYHKIIHQLILSEMLTKEHKIKTAVVYWTGLTEPNKASQNFTTYSTILD
jgi:hypothetical protein